MIHRFISILLLAALPARACLWDRDTLAQEAQGKLDTVKAITGWFDRFPPGYYEMRLKRVSKELAADPKKLDLYDDAGVAANRLGRYDEAIAWMEKKKAVLDGLPAQDTLTARYRYFANLGSFLGNRWVTKPIDERKADRADLTAAIKAISAAIELNPDAHFGREKYQLRLFDWLESSYSPAARETWNFIDLRPLLEARMGKLEPAESEKFKEMEKGMVGLIELGSAWESVDVFSALRDVLLNEGDGSLAVLAQQRVMELRKAGRGKLFGKHELVQERWINVVEKPELPEAWYRKTRQAAEARKKAWVAYQEERFDKGLHPDTHPDFWKQWQEPAFPPFSKQQR